MALTPPDQAILAAWYVKTAFVGTLSPRSDMSIITPAVVETTRRYTFNMIQDGTPPDFASVRIAHCDARDGSAEAFLPTGWRPPGGMYISIPSWPQVVCEVICSPEHIGGFLEATQDDQRFLRIWPPQPVTHQWPHTTMSMLDVVPFMQEWGMKVDLHRGGFGPAPVVRWPPTAEDT